jgi:hypothetical protein
MNVPPVDAWQYYSAAGAIKHTAACKAWDLSPAALEAAIIRPLQVF